MQALVSILIPAYNVEQYIRQCLDSILAQTYQTLQVVVIDDGSIDNTFAVCQEYARRDSRIELYHQENQGVAQTRNHLLEKIKGDYTLFVDSDDWIEKNMVEYLIKQVKMFNVDIVTFKYIINDQKIQSNKEVIEEWNREKLVYEFLRHVNFNGSLCNKLIKSDLFNDILFDIKISYGEDALVIWQIIQKVQKILVTNKVLYHYRMNDNSLSHKKWKPETKGSCSIVWNNISKETKEKWSQYSNIADARYAIEDMWCLYYASLSDYPFDDHIKNRQKNIRKNLLKIIKTRLVSKNKIIAAFILAYFYKLGFLLKYTRK